MKKSFTLHIYFYFHVLVHLYDITRKYKYFNLAQ